MWTDTPRKKKTQETRSLSFFLAYYQLGTVTAVLTWHRREDEVFRSRGCHFLPVPWLSLFQPLLYFLLTTSTTGSRYFQIRGEETESQSLGNLIRHIPQSDQNKAHRLLKASDCSSPNLWLFWCLHNEGSAQKLGCDTGQGSLLTVGRARQAEEGWAELCEYSLTMLWAEANEWAESP